jgi:hypothetical protein
MAKPTGVSGSFRVHVGIDGQVSGSFEWVPFLAIKAAVEQQMVERFIASMNKRLAQSGDWFFLSHPRGNAENDFDFTVTSPNGPAYLELMEIAPLCGPYEKAPHTYTPYEFGKVILTSILEKSGRYSRNAGRDLFLLLYVTHWSFTLSNSTIACLRYWLRAQPTLFRAIFSYQPLDSDEGASRWLFPIPPEFVSDFDPEDIRENICINFDPRNARLVYKREP